MKDKRPGLVLLGHGSMVAASTAEPVYRVAEQLRCEDNLEVCVAFWKEPPYLADAIVQVRASHVTIVPMFMASGYFTQKVLPREVARCSALINHQHYQFGRAVGEHPMMFEVLARRAQCVLDEAGINRAQLTVVVVGHGTTRHKRSSALIYEHVERFQSMGWPHVRAAFLDEAPELDVVMGALETSHVVVLPYFMANGYHTTIDIPDVLGISFGESPVTVGSQTIWYDGAIGEDASMVDVVRAHAMEVEVDGLVAGSPWADRVDAHIRHWLGQGGGVLGQLHIQVNSRGYEVTCGDPPLEVIDVAQLRRLVRGDNQARRGVPYLSDLPGQWRLHVETFAQLVSVMALVYPSLWLHRMLWSQGMLQVERVEEMLQRQTGRYACLRELARSEVLRLSRPVCAGCVRQPVWAGQVGDSPCRSMCPAVLDVLHDKVSQSQVDGATF